MFKKTITYTDYDGNSRKEDFYFNLTQTEIMEMQFEQIGGLGRMLTEIVQKQDVPKVAQMFKQIICRSYGVKTPDGKRFIKNENVLNEFLESPAYDKLYMELITSEEAAYNFIKSVIPREISEKISEDDIKNSDLLPIENA